LLLFGGEGLPLKTRYLIPNSEKRFLYILNTDKTD